MSLFACWWWWVGLGLLGGWLFSWWLSRSTRANQPTLERVVEKVVDRPVDRIVEKVVEKQIDNPLHLTRIRALETDVAAMAGLRSQIQTLQATPPKVVEKIVEKIVDRPVDRVVEKIVEKQIDNPAHLTRIRTLEADVALMAGLKSQIQALQSAPPKIVEKIVEKIVDRPVDRIVEKVVEKIVDRPVDRIVEKIVEKQFDNPMHLTRIRSLEGEVAVIAGLRSQIQALQSAPPKIVDRPVDRVVEKIVEKQIDNPVHLSRIRTLESEVAVIGGLRSQIQALQSAPPKIVEKVVEKIVDRPVDRIVEKIVDRPVDRVVEKTVERRVDNPTHLARIAELEEELRGLKIRSATVDRAAAKAAGFSVKGMDDLEVVEGIGPKIAGLLHDAGIHSFYELSQTKLAQIQVILDNAGPRYKLANPETWPAQAALAAKNRWSDLRVMQDNLTAGVKK